MIMQRRAHQFICHDFDETDYEAVLINQDYLRQGRHSTVIVFCDEKLEVGKTYRGYIRGGSPLKLRFELAQQAEAKEV